MYYYKVFPSSSKYHRNEALTYAYPEKLAIGNLAIIPLQSESCVGVIFRETNKPKFPTKELIGTLPLSLPIQHLKLIEWLQGYYPAPLGPIIQLFIPSNIDARDHPSAQQQLDQPSPVTLPSLTPEQSTATNAILQNPAEQSSFLIHGDTGTGKTRLYLEIIKDNLGKGKSSLLLTPEIGLTPQLLETCNKAFPGKVVVFHSSLNPTTRRKAWYAIALAKQPIVVVGPRSALFSPLKNIGAIILDEAHEAAYKQEQSPHYLTSRVAAQLARLHGAKLILGTATPLITDYYAFRAKSLPILRLQTIATKGAHKEPNITITNLKDRSYFSTSPWISDILIKSIRSNLANKTQSLLFLNRRGTARLVLCQSCTWQAICPRCDLPLTYHGDNHSLRCHTCGYSSTTPNSCPQCSSSDIIFKSIGTKTVEQEAIRLFPNARIKRFDSDNTSSERLEKHYESIRDGEVDIIIGTQMLSKGLDLPRLATVGIILADTNLYFPDYTADERTFQMITQVIGRVGRGHQSGNVFIQSYQPDSPSIIDATTKDYQHFYDRQVAERKQFLFPPYCFVLKLNTIRATQASAQKSANALRAKIVALNLRIDIGDPSPAFTEKTGGKFRWQLIVKSVQRNNLIKIIQQLPSGWNYDIDPTDLL